MSNLLDEINIATLGGTGEYNLTCSSYVAHKIYPNAAIIGVSSFEEGGDMVNSGEADYLLVPAAYPKINNFLMDDDFFLEEVRCERIPSLVLVTTGHSLPHQIQTLFLHPATRPLMKYIEVEVLQPYEVKSNYEAGFMLTSAQPGAAAITNELVADHLQLTIHRVLRPARPMGWLLFRKTSK